MTCVRCLQFLSALDSVQAVELLCLLKVRRSETVKGATVRTIVQANDYPVATVGFAFAKSVPRTFGDNVA